MPAFHLLRSESRSSEVERNLPPQSRHQCTQARCLRLDLQGDAASKQLRSTSKAYTLGSNCIAAQEDCHKPPEKPIS
jgi:hypothetical protein